MGSALNCSILLRVILTGTKVRSFTVVSKRKLALILKQSDAFVSKRFTFTSLSRYLFKIFIGHVIRKVMWFRPADQGENFNLVLNSNSSSNIFLRDIDIITWIDFWWYQANRKSCARNVDRKPIRRFRNTSWRSYFLSRITPLSDNVSKAA